jgi:ribosomal protein S27E
MVHLDGNVLAGTTSGLFAFDATKARGQCAACADIATLGEAMVFGQPMGYVTRCRACGAVLMVIVEAAGRTRLSLEGLRWVQITGGAR